MKLGAAPPAANADAKPALATGGLVALVYGFSEPASKGWRSTTFLGSAIVSIVLLAAFVVVEAREPSPSCRCGSCGTAAGPGSTSRSR